MALPQAPWPTLQLLRSVDLHRARAEWLRSGAPGPGALTLLLRNKAQLRQLGRQQLQQRFEELRDFSHRVDDAGVLRLDDAMYGHKDSHVPDSADGKGRVE